jgi:acetamidase/formamidase
MEEGKKLTDKMWKICEEKQGSTVAKDEYGMLMDQFFKYSALQPGTHVSEVSKAAEHALLAKVPRSSYKVGIDSKLAPIVGMMPTGMRETITRHGMYGILSPAGTVKGYQV